LLIKIIKIMNEAYIVAYSRSAFAKAKKGGFRSLRSDDMAIQVIQNLMRQVPQLNANQIDDLIVGCANPEGEQGLQIGRQIALRALGMSTAGMTVNRYCASGIETIAIATAKIRAGMGSCLNYTVAEQHPNYVIGMGLTAEAVSKKYSINREDQDQFSMRSHQLAALAQDQGKFAKEIGDVSVLDVTVSNNKRVEKTTVINSDEGIRRDTTVEALLGLKPAFANKGSVTAGNSSQTTDGAGFVIVMSESMVKTLGIEPLGRLVSSSVVGVDPLYMGIGPCAAIPKALEQANLKLNDISLIELNEAFAAQSLAVIRETGLDPNIVNVNGGAIALGHPLGCSGARLSMTLLRELKERKQKYGIATACIGGGQGIAAVIEAF
jgi:acetyl-CoA acyltransferase